jgi:hypothetical protein
MRRLSWVILGVVAVGVVGCASTATKTTVAPSSTFDSDIDYEYVTIVDDMANQRGHKIVWVHPPQKKKPVE